MSFDGHVSDPCPTCEICVICDEEHRDEDWYDTHCPTCDAPEPTHAPSCAVPFRPSAEEHGCSYCGHEEAVGIGVDDDGDWICADCAMPTDRTIGASDE